jgi:hypothetical protein
VNFGGGNCTVGIGGGGGGLTGSMIFVSIGFWMICTTLLARPLVSAQIKSTCNRRTTAIPA